MTTAGRHLSQPGYRPDIDGLRGVAVLAVVAFHAFPDLVQGGFVGVDVFFVISGYLISTIIFDSLEKGTFSFAEFYARRIKRIFPALILVLSVFSIVGWFALLADEYKQFGKHVAAGAGFISNLIFWNEAGYFDNSAETKPLLHLWSLGIEEQFYILLPLFLWFAWKCRCNLLAITLIVAVASFTLNARGVKHNAVAAFYSPQTRFWELLIGSALAWMSLYNKNVFGNIKDKLDGFLGSIIGKKRQGGGDTLSNLLYGVGLILLMSGFWGINKEVSFPGKWALVPVLGAAFIIMAGAESWASRTMLSSKVMVWFGLISFPLYLWHWPLLSFARIVESEIPAWSVRITVVLLSIIFAWLTYRLIERPVRLGKRANLVPVLLVLMTMVGFVGHNIDRHDGLTFRSGINEINLVNAEFVGPLWKYTKNERCQKAYPLEGSDKYGWWFCMASSEAKPTLLILGNSYANHFYPGVITNENLKHHSVLSIGTCDASWVDKSNLDNEVTFSPCSGYQSFDQQELINNIVITQKSVRYAIIGGLPDKPDADYVVRLKKRIDFLEANQVRVIIFVPHVRVDYDIKGCYARPFKNPKQACQIPADVYRDLLKNFSLLVDSLKKTNPHVLVFDQNTMFCTEDVCNFKLPVMPAFRDEYAHYSEFASVALFKKFVEWAKINAPEILRL